MTADSITGSTARELALRHGIVALDFPEWQAAENLVDALGDEAAYYKVGLQLFTATGPDAVRRMSERGKKVFLDLKLHDIPNTVAGATRRAASLGASLLTVHAGGGTEMIRAAVDSAGDDLRIIAVTVLTSLSADALPAHFRRDQPLDEIVMALTQEALDAGAHGVVLSGAEVGRIKARFGDRCLTVVPGVRPAGSGTQDQARVVTPEGALRDGADHLVIGRAVNRADDPLGAWRRLWCLAETT
jgi:orotidine-5'-phosphate decarboxylase